MGNTVAEKMGCSDVDATLHVGFMLKEGDPEPLFVAVTCAFKGLDGYDGPRYEELPNRRSAEDENWYAVVYMVVQTAALYAPNELGPATPNT